MAEKFIKREVRSDGRVVLYAGEDGNSGWVLLYIASPWPGGGMDRLETVQASMGNDNLRRGYLDELAKPRGSWE